MGIKAALKTIAAVILGSSTVAVADAQAQINFDALAFSICKKIAPDTARLKCFDEIGAKQDQKPAADAPHEPAKWEYETDTSPIDDSTQVSASLKGSDNSLLVLRCKEHRTEAAFIPGEFFMNGIGNSVPTIVRLNEDPPLHSTWSASTNGRAAFAPHAIDFIRSLPDGGKLFIRLTGFQGRTVDGKFDLADVSATKGKIEEACKWSTPKADKAETTPKKQPAKRQPLKKPARAEPLILSGQH